MWGAAPQEDPQPPCQLAATCCLFLCYHVSSIFVASTEDLRLCPPPCCCNGNLGFSHRLCKDPAKAELHKCVTFHCYCLCRCFCSSITLKSGEVAMPGCVTKALPRLLSYEATVTVTLAERLMRRRRRGLIISLGGISQVSFNLCWCPWRKCSHKP